MEGSTFLRYESPEHIIELEVSDNEVNTVVFMRFALCQLPTIDSLCVSLGKLLRDALRATVVIADDIDANRPPAWLFDGNDSPALWDAVVDSIHKKRLLWQSDFGTEQVRLLTRDALQRFVFRLK